MVKKRKWIRRTVFWTLFAALIALLMLLILRAIRKYNFMFLGTEQS